MTDTSSSPPSKWPAPVVSVATCIEAIGGDGFDESLLTLLRETVDIEQCMIFSYGRNDALECLLAANERQPRVAGRLAELYQGGLFRQDPNYQRLRQLVDGKDITAEAKLTTMQGEAMPQVYRSHLFAFPDLVDKASLSVPAVEGAYYLNLYRGIAHGPFQEEDLIRLNGLAPLLVSLIRRHYAHAIQPSIQQRPSPEEASILAPLSERERQLCLFLLRGHTLKTAAAELDIALSTAETYRKRAYAKLGVPSKAKLVVLCRRT